MGAASLLGIDQSDFRVLQANVLVQYGSSDHRRRNAASERIPELYVEVLNRLALTVTAQELGPGLRGSLRLHR
jgi:hypothetical protein